VSEPKPKHTIDLKELLEVRDALFTLMDWEILKADGDDGYYAGWVDALTWVKDNLVREEK